jgi:L-rhamnose mutarotase
MNATERQRVCFQLQVKPERLAEYRERHASVWPDMLREIAASGRQNYSLFLRDDGLLIGYFEVESLEASQAYLDASPVAARWEVEMAEFFETLAGSRPDQSLDRLDEVFNLAEQLDNAASSP